jgi:purine-cytosine permease-like protein
VQPLASADIAVPVVPEEPVEDWETLLFNNQHIGIHRFAFLLTRYPAIIIILLSSWYLFGRGSDSTNLMTSENNMSIASLVAGILTALGTVVGGQNHNNSPKDAQTKSLVRVGSSVVNIVVILTAAAFAAVALGDLREQKETTLPTCYPVECLSLNERISSSGVILGLSILIVALSVFVLLYGIFAVLRLRRDRKHRRVAAQRNAAAYANPHVALVDVF